MENQKAIYGIVGYPVKHSLSPVMHNTAFQELGVDAEYKLFPLKREELPEFFAKLKEKDSNIFGLNVTVPYKEDVIPFLDSLSPFAKRVMAVNTIVISSDRKLSGYNTDGPGFLTQLTELGFDIAKKRVAMIGAGGTTRALLAVMCLIPERPESIKIYNRTAENLDSLLDDLGQRIDLSIIEKVQSVDDLNVELADILINTTSVGMKPEDPCLVDESIIHSNLLVYDVIYSPLQTKLLKLAETKGAQGANGLGMLFYQGVLALQHWANAEIDDSVKLRMRESLHGAINERN